MDLRVRCTFGSARRSSSKYNKHCVGERSVIRESTDSDVVERGDASRVVAAEEAEDEAGVRVNAGNEGEDEEVWDEDEVEVDAEADN
jgi:hypothetical protein